MNCPEHTHLDRRIARAYERYMRAKGEWASAWAQAFVMNTSARNAIAAVERVRFPARDRGSQAGSAAIYSQSLADLGEQFTKGLTNGSRGVR